MYLRPASGGALSCVFNSTFSVANLRTRAGSRLSFRSLISGRFPRALDVEAGSRAADGAVLIELPHAFVETMSSQMFGHQVGGVFGPKDLAQLQFLRTLPFLDPKAADINVPQFPCTLALGDGQGCG